MIDSVLIQAPLSSMGMLCSEWCTVPGTLNSTVGYIIYVNDCSTAFNFMVACSAKITIMAKSKFYEDFVFFLE